MRHHALQNSVVVIVTRLLLRWYFLRWISLAVFLSVTVKGLVLTPPNRNLAYGRRIEATHTCGEVNGQAIREMYCTIAGANPYSPHNQYSYKMTDEDSKYREVTQIESFLQNGQNCDYCMANTSRAHPASYMVDGIQTWWQSPPLSRGMQYREVNITIDLEQEFHVAYVWIQMANSPRPSTWILERSTDFGKTFQPWQYFASSPAECHRLFGIASLRPIVEDDSVICTSDFSGINPMEDGEIMINLLENRPGKYNFTVSEKLHNFVLATHVRIRLLRPKTLHGHFMDLHGEDPHSIESDTSVTRRYFYSIKEIFMGGRCVCNGHADSCDVLDASRPRTYLCRCEHNTCGDKCERCCEGFVQKRWQRNQSPDQHFECERCNCHGHSDFCKYDSEVDEKSLSLDIHGKYAGGGRCIDCQDNTEGINCNKCKSGFYRPAGKKWNEVDVCQECICDPTKHTGNCAEESGQCECLPQFTGDNCDMCAEGYYHAPECRPCECYVNGTVDGQCLPTDSVCPCKEGYTGQYCDTCAASFTNITAGCVNCNCDSIGSENPNCNSVTGQCVCRAGYAGPRCEQCSKGYFNHPNCDNCDCDGTGTENEICDQKSGQCLCKEGFAGRRCDKCDEEYYNYPNCYPCECDRFGSSSPKCNPISGECSCYVNFTSRTCNRCATKYYRFPDCLECGCNVFGSKGVTCNDYGQCYCKDESKYQGKHCELCADKLYNFPICEACNCHPSGVIPEFGGCDKVPPGELCTCRKNVMGHTCSHCKPTYWDLQAYHEDGCIECNCNKTGTLSLLDTCDVFNGQCPCKLYASGLKCDTCAEGFYNLRSDNEVGCQPCNCDVGGSIGINCDLTTGQCRCKPRIQGLKCDQPIDNHYFPTLWHIKYEAEDGRSPDGRPVRFAIDSEEFPNYSWRGFVVFSPIQDEIILDVDIPRSSLYKVLFHYKNPLDPLEVELRFRTQQYGQEIPDNDQRSKVILERSDSPTNKSINKDKDNGFLLSAGKWQLSIKSAKRLFLDYVVLIPAPYYLGNGLVEYIPAPCTGNTTTTDTSCIKLQIPPLPSSAVQVSPGDSLTKFHATDTTRADIPLETRSHGQAVFIKTDDEHSLNLIVEIDVPRNGTYYMLVEYHNTDENVSLPIKVNIEQDNIPISDGVLPINACPYTPFIHYHSIGRLKNRNWKDLGLSESGLDYGVNRTFKKWHQGKCIEFELINNYQMCYCTFGILLGTLCREVITNNGREALLKLNESPPKVKTIFTIQPGRQFEIASVNLVNMSDWSTDQNKPVIVCIMKNGRCMGPNYDQPPNSIVIEAEAGKNVNNSIPGNKLPFPVDKEVVVMSLDNARSTIDVEGVVASPGDYMFIVHYFNPDNPPFTADVFLNDVGNSEASFAYCPSMTGCRTNLIFKDTGDIFTHIDDKYLLSFYYNELQKGPLYIDYVMAVPKNSNAKSALQPTTIDLSTDYAANCSAENYANLPSKVTEYCRKKIFTLISISDPPMSCNCNVHGSLDLACKDYGGQCNCKPNVIGRTCSKCAPGYYDFPKCKRCNCEYNQQCDELNGQCFCPPYVEGISCDRCVNNAFGYDALIGCQLCGCHADGSHNGECDSHSGQCLCKDNVGGRQCQKCLPGFYAFPQCHRCACLESGTNDDICDANTAQCLCKKNVIGEHCDVCRPGTFDLRKSDQNGCSDCFCFGITDRCTSSQFPVQVITLEGQSWKTDDVNGRIEAENGRITYYASENVDSSKLPPSVYFEVPIQSGGDYTAMYGLHMSFVISSFPPEEKQLNAAADVQIVSGTTTLEYWSPEQQTNFSYPFKIVVTLFPEYWVLKSGEPASRAQLMMVLLKLEKIRIKASYYKRTPKVILENFEIEIAVVEPYQASSGLIYASSVEICECPAPYTGSSCQYCASGYHRVQTAGSQMGACVPCNCNGHSGTCNPDTGICSNCQHNTFGDHCEFCMEGFYGNATTGSPSSCLRCACPYPTENNNFAVSCAVTEHGILERCVCKKGYSGDQCESCATGYYGEPMRLNEGECKSCFCNENNDLSEDGACHPINGDCALCTHNTDGRHCEYCKDWYFGDAINSKNCSECSCNQCGSEYCDNSSGFCKCHPLVEGRNCDRCVENAWNFHSCHGCEMCGCQVAASNSQCDLKTGQCACMPGAGGRYCERCEDGFWDYGPQGCKKCDCEADLSMGTVCDVNTGQCHCQIGATGPRCDTCIENYLKVPKFGCRQCDECVYALNTELDRYDIAVNVLNMTIGNVSGVAVTGARLRRVQNAIAYLEPKFDNAITMKSNNNELTNVLNEAITLKEAGANVEIRADRTAQQLELLKNKLDETSNQLIQLHNDVNDLTGVSNYVIEKIEKLRDSFDNTAPVENQQELVNDAERLVENLKLTQNITALNLLESKLEDMQKTINKIVSFKEKSNSQLDAINAKQLRLQQLTNASAEFTAKLHGVRGIVNYVKTTLNGLSLFPLRAILNGIEKDEGEVTRSIKIGSEKRDNATQLLNYLKELKDTLSSQINELTELKNLFAPENSLDRRSRRAIVNKKLVDEKVTELEKQAARIVGIYDATKLEASNAVGAANIYKEVRNTLAQAKNLTQQAQINTAIARKISKGKKEKTRQSRRESDNIAVRVQELDKEKLFQLQQMQTKLQGRVEELMPKLEKTVNDFKQLNISSVADNLLELDNVLGTADNAYSNLQPLNESFAQLKSKIEDADNRVKQLINSNTGLSLSSETANDQLQQVLKSIPESKSEWELAKSRLSNTSSLVEECKTRLALLKEKIAIARDMANGVKVGAHFEVGSFLELPLTQTADDFGYFTEIRVFFRTITNNGILLYFGSENPQLSGEFIVIELEDGRPKVTLNFGREPVSVHLQTRASDFLWREISVERIGRRAHVYLTMPQFESRYAEDKVVMSSSSKSVLNLFNESTKLYVGGLPVEFKRPNAIRQYSYVGDLDKLRLNGELLGFWNSKRAINVRGADMRTPVDVERSAKNEVSFNGRGFMQLNVETWAPRMHTVLLFSFSTFSPDGLLFFVGKDRDQLIIELDDGHVSLAFDLGSGLARLKSNEGNYNDGKWHMVQVQRTGRQAKLDIDGSHDVTEGESPGSMFEMSVPDSFFIGGLPQSIETRFAVQPFRGCVKNLKLGTEYVNFNDDRVQETKGMQNSCPNNDVRVASLISERAFSKFTNLQTATDTKEIELAFRFKTTQASAHLASVSINDEEVLKLTLEDGLLIVRAGENDNENLLSAELSARLAGGWHYVTTIRTADIVKLYVDDMYSTETGAHDISDIISQSEATLTFGGSSQGYIGCIGDVVYNGNSLSFSQSQFNEVKLMGCTLNTEQTIASTITPEDTNDENRAQEIEISTTTSVFKKQPLQQWKVRPEGSCALPEVSHGEREDSNGIRFGLVSGSRLEFDRPPDTFIEHSLVLSIQLRATAANGILKFVANEKHTDFMALYLQYGKIHFAFGSGNAKVVVHGKQSILDDEWHIVRAEREGSVAALYIDGRQEAEDRTDGTEVIDAQPPLYIGGLPNDLVAFAARILPGVKSEFGGCLRDFKLNDKKFDDAGREIGTVPCSQHTENGIYFGKEGGYAIVNPQFVMGLSFSFELEIKPRTKNAVLLSVGALNFLTLQILNGTVKFSVDTGAGVESVVYEPATPNLICDGHWHQIKLYKKKNLITLNVDGKSNLRIMKKKSIIESTTKDPLYLGGVPKDVKLKGLDTLDPYVGCVRILNVGKRGRKRKDASQTTFDLSDMILFGSVERNICPLN